MTLHTDLGDIKIELYCDKVPKACEVRYITACAVKCLGEHTFSISAHHFHTLPRIIHQYLVVGGGGGVLIDNFMLVIGQVSLYVCHGSLFKTISYTVTIKDTPKEDKPPNKGQLSQKYSCIHTL